MKRTLLAASLAALLALPATAAEYKVGILLPFSGVYAGLGAHIENGFKLGLEHFGDKLGDNTITTVRDDTEANPGVALSKAKKMVLSDKVDVLTGIVSSAVLGGLRDFVHNAKVPLVVANAGNDDATGERCSPYITRVSFSNGSITRVMGPWLVEQGVKTAYLMAPDYAAGHQMMDAFRATFEAAGGKIVGEAYPPLQGTKDYGPYIAKAQASGAHALFTFFAGGAAIAFVKQYAEFEAAEDLPLYGAGFLTSAAYVHVQGKAADGIIASLHYVPTIDTPENKRFQEGYQAANDGKLGSEFAVAGYDAARLIVEAIAVAGDDKAKFRKALNEVSFDGPRGPLKIDPATHNVIQNMYIFENRFADGEVTQKVLATIEGVQDPVNGCKM